MKYYIYQPHFMDQYDPCVIMGVAITPGAKVYVDKTNVDPAGIFRYVTDEKGNRQSVMRSSLVSLKQALQIKETL